VTVVVHERVAKWARQVRPHLAVHPARLIETRGAGELVAAVRQSAGAILLVDLADRPSVHLDHLDGALRANPGALSVVFERTADEGVRQLAREIGATVILPFRTTPPVVLGLLDWWIPLSLRRARDAGWTPEPVEADPIELLLRGD
jgi:hypothetical protein